jgi:UMF1 family MFS transporter
MVDDNDVTEMCLVKVGPDLIDQKTDVLLGKELRAWYIYEWSIAPFFVTVMTLLPLLITDQAKEEAIKMHGSKWVTSRGTICKPQENNEYDKACFQIPLKNGVIGGLDYAAFAQYCSVISVILQLIVYLTFTGFGDYGKLRRKLLVLSHIVGSLCCIFVIFENSNQLYVLGGMLLIFSNVFLGMAGVFYNSYLPLIVMSLREYNARTMTDVAQNDGNKKLSSLISSRGLVIGYVSQLSNLLISLAILGTLVDGTLGVRLVCLMTGLWLILFSLYPFYHLQDRKGPQLPPNVVQICWQRFKETLMLYKRFPEMFKFLSAYLIYSDGNSTIGQAAAIFALVELVS